MYTIINIIPCTNYKGFPINDAVGPWRVHQFFRISELGGCLGGVKSLKTTLKFVTSVGGIELTISIAHNNSCGMIISVVKPRVQTVLTNRGQFSIVRENIRTTIRFSISYLAWYDILYLYIFQINLSILVIRINML